MFEVGHYGNISATVVFGKTAHPGMNAACGLVVPLWTGTSPAGFPVGAAGPCRGGAGSTRVARQAPGTTFERRSADRIDGRPGSYSRRGPSDRRIRFDQEEAWGRIPARQAGSPPRGLRPRVAQRL